MKLNLKTAMIFDAVCACSLIYYHKDYNQSYHKDYNQSLQYEVLEILRERTGDIFKEGAPSYSTMCGIVARFISDPASATLDDLRRMFESISEVDTAVRQKVKNEFQQSYVFPTLDMLKNGGAKKYCEYIDALKDAGFEELWQEKIYSAEKEQIDKLHSAFANADIDVMLETISALKGVPCNGVTVYISLLSYPVSFTLDETSFLDTINDFDDYYKSGFLSMIAHELMHGFASSELTQIYLNFVNSSRYLKSTHKSLLEDMHSGDEEEFVMAAEYYILWRAKIMTKEQIVLNKYSRYGGCVPLALYIFDHMTKESADIVNYDRWLIKSFSDGIFSADNIFQTVDSLLPIPNDYDNFFANLFVILQRSAYIIRSTQLCLSDDIKNKIEQLIGEAFVYNSDRSISFANGTKELGTYISRETLVSNNLTVERIEFGNKKDALAFDFPYRGSNVGVPDVEYGGEKIKRPYILNMAYHKDRSNRAEFSFVCGNTRYLITSACRDCVVDIDTEEDQNATYRAYGTEMIEAVKKAESIVMLLK